jgi:hypothetical protein
MTAARFLLRGRRKLAASLLAALLVALLAAFPGTRTALAQSDPNDPETCTELWQEIGFPSIDEGADVDFVIVCHAGYVLAHNNRTKTPDWVIEH